MPIDESLDKIWEEHLAVIELKKTTKWALGFRDRGHGHGDFAIILDDSVVDVEPAVKLIADNIEKELAEYIIELHNSHFDIAVCHE